MEAKLALQLTVELFGNNNERLALQKLVSDDDSTMRSLLQHRSKHEKGQLPEKYHNQVF